MGYVAGDWAAGVAVLDGGPELARGQSVLASLPGLKKIIVGDPAACPAGDQYLSWAEFTALGRERLAAAPDAVADRVAAIGPDDPATLLYTSGTTGNPNGVIVTHRSRLYEIAAANAAGTLMPHTPCV